jgi:hypothetical protein
MQVVKVLMYMPKEYASYLMDQGAVQPLLDLLHFQVETVVHDREE